MLHTPHESCNSQLNKECEDILGVFVTTHTMYNIILNNLNYYTLQGNKLHYGIASLPYNHTIILYNQVWVYKSDK